MYLTRLPVEAAMSIFNFSFKLKPTFRKGINNIKGDCRHYRIINFLSSKSLKYTFRSSVDHDVAKRHRINVYNFETDVFSYRKFYLVVVVVAAVAAAAAAAATAAIVAVAAVVAVAVAVAVLNKSLLLQLKLVYPWVLVPKLRPRNTGNKPVRELWVYSYEDPLR
jgi:hypothetical protein